MRREAILILISYLLFPLSSFSQGTYDWYPVKPGNEYNYQFDTALTISNVIRIDSSRNVAGNIRYFLNKIVKPCDTCVNQNLNNDPVDSTYVLNRQPQFLLHWFSFAAPNQLYFKGTNKSLVLKIHTFPGATWIYDSVSNITAIMVSKGVQTVFGNSDSVCTIALSSSDTLVLSKQFGLLQFSDYAISKFKYRLQGIKGSPNYGVQQKFFPDFFNFSAGNVFQYSFFDYDYNFFPPLFKDGHEKWEILNVTNYPDSVVCQIKQTYFDSTKIGGNSPTITSYTQTIKQVFIDSTDHFTNYYPSQEIWANAYFLYPGSSHFIHRLTNTTNSNGKNVKRFGEVCPNNDLTAGNTGAAEETSFPNVFINRNSGGSKKIVGREATEGLGITSELFNNYDRVYQRCLIGYIKGTDTSGVIYDMPVGLKENNLANAYKVYPNPAKEIIFIENPSEDKLHLSIFSIDGRLVLDAHLLFRKEKIDLSGLTSGIYLLQVNSKEKTFREKIILTD